MVPELEKPRITEIRVRMDCNGCVQKIKKALNGINGIYDLYIDFPQQKLTIVGWADPDKIVKAIKKTRKIAVICSHTEAPQQPPAQQTDQQPPQATTPAQEAATPPPPQAQPPEATPPAEPPKNPPTPPAQENSQPEPAPSPASVATESNATQPAQPSGPGDVGQVHVIHHHPANYGYATGYGSQRNRFHPTQVPPSPPVHVTRNYNTYKPSPYITEYEFVRSPPHHRPAPFVTEYVRSPPRQTYYSRMDRYSEEYNSGSSSNGNITSMFSDENPNACRIA